MLQGDARDDETEFIRLGGLTEIAGPRAELVRGDVELIDRDHEVVEQPVDDFLVARVALVVVKSGRLGGELLDDRLADQVRRHRISSFCALFGGCRNRLIDRLHAPTTDAGRATSP